MSEVATQISFARGAPSLDIVAVDDLRAAANAVIEKDPVGVFAYGTAVGYPPLRRWLAAKHGVGEANVMVTNGSMQADAFLFELMVQNGDQVIIEQPTYDRTLLNLTSRGAKFVTVPLEDDGLDVDALEEKLKAGARPKLAHIIPNFHNPAGCTLSETKRRRLVELAVEYDFIIFEDDPYVDISFEGAPPASMYSIDTSGKVVYVSSFTKTVAPGLRVGYVIGAEALIAQLVKLATNTYISPGMVAQGIVAEFCESGKINQSIETVSNALRDRRDALCEALTQKLPRAKFVKPAGGYFLWVEMPEGFDVDEAFERAASVGVQIVKGTDFMIEGGQNTFRLAYAGVQPDEIREGIERLAKAIS